MKVGDLVSFDMSFMELPEFIIGLIVQVYSFKNNFIEADFLWSDHGMVQRGTYHSLELELISRKTK